MCVMSGSPSTGGFYTTLETSQAPQANYQLALCEMCHWQHISPFVDIVCDVSSRLCDTGHDWYVHIMWLC